MLMRISRARFIAPILAFMHGAILAAILILSMLSNFEDQLYDNLLASAIDADMSEQEIALSLLHVTHRLLEPRYQQFQQSRYNSVLDQVFRSSDTQLIDANRECGSYTHVLGRLLQRAGFEIRIAQMKCGNSWGCHILLEAKVDGRFVSLDALYDLAFFKPNGQLASFSEVGQDWDRYRDQTPSNYVKLYAYEGVRYTNWNKVPILMPALKQLMRVLLGDKVETLSLRSWVLNVYKTYMVILLLLYAFLFFISVNVIVRRLKPT